jgi:hypothetical protein
MATTASCLCEALLFAFKTVPERQGLEKLLSNSTANTREC